MDSMEYLPFESALRLMQRELVEILQQRICWADKEEVAEALRVVRMDYEAMESERRSRNHEDEPEQGRV